MPPLVGVLVAAGSSSRMGLDKLWIEIAGRPVWRWAFDAMIAVPDMAAVAVVTPAGSEAAFRERIGDAPHCLIVPGGSVRADSVLAGLDALANHGLTDETVVLVHDAARPAAGADLLDRVRRAASSGRAVVPVVPARDSLWRVAGAASGDAIMGEPVDRDRAVVAQTPQAARLGDLRVALREARAAGESPGDEAAALTARGIEITTVAGEPENVKLTDPGDERLLEAVLLRRGVPAVEARDVPTGARAGIGFDAHRLATGRPMILGGLPFADEPRGPAGHSDGDVVLHAVVDALLGAARLGDIGGLFPDEERWRAADSAELLRQTLERVARCGFAPTSVDVTVVAAAPRIAPRAAEMAVRVAGLIGLAVTAVNVKATTTDGLGFPAGEGIAAYAVVVVERR
ncbi:MAG: 2-C-methyl-D-erythritol 2,4-cyclodiphosphate synthase [Candidatus Limnocylindria bacterium]